MSKLPPGKMLLVEDDAVFLGRLASSLRRRGHEVMTASTLDEVSAILARFSPDCAVVDLRLDGESGLDVVRLLREKSAPMRILVLTGYGSIATAVDAMRLGAVNYLSKPADTDQIEAALFGQPDVSAAPVPETRVPSLDRVEWEHMQRVLHDNDGNISATARKLGIERRTLQRKLSKYPPET